MNPEVKNQSPQSRGGTYERILSVHSGRLDYPTLSDEAWGCIFLELEDPLWEGVPRGVHLPIWGNFWSNLSPKLDAP